MRRSLAWWVVVWGGCGGNAVIGPTPVLDGGTVDATDGAPEVDAWASAPDAAIEPSTELVEPQVALDGDPGGSGGDVILRAGSISFDLAETPPAPPPLPAGGISISSASLDHDLTRPGTILLVGSIVTSGDDTQRVITSTGGDIVVGGQLRTRAAHALVLRAPEGTVFVTGWLDTRGPDGTAGGGLVIEARAVVITGVVLAPGADVELDAGEDIELTGELHARGGALTIEAGGDVWLGGVVDARGGDELEVDAGGALHVIVPLRSRGGDGGDGGTLTWRSRDDVVIASEIDLSGGRAGRGGGVVGRAESGGDLTVTPTGALILDGGEGGDGGEVLLETQDGDASMAGRIFARGGAATGARGGGGGIVDVFTDANHNGIGGDLTIETTGVIDVSGGAGVPGGSARNNGRAGVALFPDHQEQIAVLLNSDGIHGGPRNGVLENLGLVIARGAAEGGDGGDVMFHGRQDDADLDPAPGELDLEGDDHDGDFAAE